MFHPLCRVRFSAVRFTPWAVLEICGTRVCGAVVFTLLINRLRWSLQHHCYPISLRAAIQVIALNCHTTEPKKWTYTGRRASSAEYFRVNIRPGAPLRTCDPTQGRWNTVSRPDQN
ncbi:hypothetical protein L210DRAFT_3535372 [Boletus edulis BED1]|uniref:Uncharacterized protein n=1 Tax=Boletus edulis BED1 TaxID=1328754 RepID=A0AAD4BZK2_BOLED|nr:hypothetical protein L210DRAFT_3535372 [Boletus edulis BED1]